MSNHDNGSAQASSLSMDEARKRIAKAVSEGMEADAGWWFSDRFVWPLVQSLLVAARADERERVARAIDDAALHVMSNASSDTGAALTAAILERASNIARTAEVSDQ